MQELKRNNIKEDYHYHSKVLQFGGGNFLRAFADWMIDILNEEAEFNGGIIVIKPTEHGDYSELRRQEGLYHVHLSGIRNGRSITQNRLIKCINKVIHPYLDWSEYLTSAEDPKIRYVISNTTESGIVFNNEDRFGHAPPKEFPAKLTAWLYHRFQCFLGDENKGCIFLPCELIEQNGETLKNCVLQYAEAWELGWDFQKWVTYYNYFCNTLVDRIVSGFPRQNAAVLQEEIGFKDDLLVVGEYYHSWIIQVPKKARNEIPFSQDKLNVKLVKDLKPYREMKVRLLNGAHTSMVPIGYLMGLKTVDEVMANELTSTFIIEELKEEIGPTLSIPMEEVEKFIEETIERFRNPNMQHQLLSIGLNSFSKFKTRLLPSLLQFQQQQQRLPKRIVFSLAALIHFYKGTWQGETILLKDHQETIGFFNKIWYANPPSPDQIANLVLANKKLWGQNLLQIPNLSKNLSNLIGQIEQKGIKPVLSDLITQTITP